MACVRAEGLATVLEWMDMFPLVFKGLSEIVKSWIGFGTLSYCSFL